MIYSLTEKQLQKIREEIDPDITIVDNETRVLLFNVMVDAVREKVEGFSGLFFKVYPEITKDYLPEIRKRYFRDFTAMIDWMKKTKDFLVREKAQRNLATKILLAQMNEKHPKSRFGADDRGNLTVIETPCPRVDARLVLCNGTINIRPDDIELKGYSAFNFKMAIEEFEQRVKKELKMDREGDSPCRVDLESCRLIGFRKCC